MRDYGGFDNGMRCEPPFLFESVARVKNIPRGALTSTFFTHFYFVNTKTSSIHRLVLLFFVLVPVSATLDQRFLKLFDTHSKILYSRMQIVKDKNLILYEFLVKVNTIYKKERHITAKQNQMIKHKKR